MESALVKKGLTGNQIKMIGVVLMFIDHIHQMFFMYGVPTWVDWFGRPVAMIFLFFCAEGFHYTRNRTRYLLQLLAGYVLMLILSELLWRVMPSEVQLINSIFGTLFLAAWLMLAVDTIRARKIVKGILMLLAPVASSVLVYVVMMNDAFIPALKFVRVIPNFLTVEGSFMYPILGLLFYLLRKNRWLQMIPLAAFSIYLAVNGSSSWLCIFAAIPLLLYNGQRGKGSKYFFYIFYPAHIYGLYILSYLYGKIQGVI
ncbi:membrane protein [Clostridia bacterium]|nr:membrane protein [Clostridia bacterium]